MMPVAILCGGKGTRLAPLTDHCPKYLVDVNGKPFAWWQIQLLKSHGYTDLVLCTGHLHEQIEAYVGDGSQWGVQVRYCREEKPLGVDGAIRQALPLLGERFFTLYGDSYLECDYAEIERLFRLNCGDFDAILTWYAGVDYGLRAFDLYPPDTAEILHMSQPFREIGSHAGLEQLRSHLSDPNQPDSAVARPAEDPADGRNAGESA